MFCPQCGTSNDDTSRFCRSCGAGLTSAPPQAVQPTPPPPPPPVYTPQQQYPQQQPQYAGDPRMRGQAPAVQQQKQYAVGRNPVVALILSALIIGVGQFYNGDAKKGAVMLILAIVLVPVTVGVLWLPFAIWSAIDAYLVASGKSPLW